MDLSNSDFASLRALYPVSIEPLIEEEITQVVNVINEAYKVEGFKRDPTRITEDSFRAIVSSGNSKHYIARLHTNDPLREIHGSEIPNGIVGHIMVEDRDTYGYFGMLASMPQVQGRAIGAKLLEFAEEQMKREGKKQSGCQVASPVLHLINYYAKRGYYLTGETEPWESPVLLCKAWFVMMKKDL